MIVRRLLCLCVIPVAVAGQAIEATLPAAATSKLASSLEAASTHGRHVWRDTPPINADGTVNGYIEIATGDRRKWELNIGRQVRVIDRLIDPRVGGYPINYGFVPQTVSYDGDPFDILVLGPPLQGGTLARGVIVGLMQMRDAGIDDAKVAVSPVTRQGRAAYALRGQDRETLTAFFNRYKQDVPGASTNIPGWGSAANGLAYVRQTHAFFLKCRGQAGRPCILN